jgi:excisionase family DNA binding protein
MVTSTKNKDWLSLTEAGDLLGVHRTTLRRWVDGGDVPHFRTPGGHRRFRTADLITWMQGEQTTFLGPQPEASVQSAVGLARQDMAQQHVSAEGWYAAFGQEEDRQRMRDTGRQLFGLAIQYMSRTRKHEPILQEGRRIGEFYGQQSAQHDISLVDTVRAFFFFRESLLRAAKPGQVKPGHYDAEDVRIHRQLRQFLDEVMYACLASYEVTCRHLLLAGDVP